MPVSASTIKDPVITLAMKVSDFDHVLNQKIVKVSGLSASRYQLKIDGDDVTELNRDQLESGVNLVQFDTPMNRQAAAVHDLTLRHNNIHFQRWRTYQVPYEKKSYPGLARALEGLDALEDNMVAEQRALAKPKNHRFELVPRP
jgi:hypothetical protein